MPAADTSRHLRRQVLGAPHQRGSSQALAGLTESDGKRTMARAIQSGLLMPGWGVVAESGCWEPYLSK
jgi:hypothetical protein